MREERIPIHSEKQRKALEYALEQIKKSSVADYIMGIYLYGSCARGEERPDSDVDLFIILSDAFPYDNKRLRKALSDLYQEVMMPGQFVRVDLAVEIGSAWRGSNATYFRNIRKDGIFLWRPEYVFIPMPAMNAKERKIPTYLDKAEEILRNLSELNEAGFCAAPMATDAHFVCESCMKHIIDTYYLPEDDRKNKEETWVLRTHNLYSLLNFLSQELDIHYPLECERGIREICGYYFTQHEAGIADMGRMTEEEIGRCVQVAEMCHRETVRICGEMESKRRQEWTGTENG